MPGIILQAKHKIIPTNVTYIVNIWDRDAETSPLNVMRLRDPFFTLSNEGSEDIFHKIIPANATIIIQTGIPESNDNVIQFYDDVTNSSEGRYFLEIRQQEGNVTIFRGKILVDTGDFLIDKYGDFSIKAICGLTDLKNVEYRPTGYTDLTPEYAIKTYSFRDHFESILRRNQVVDFFKDINHDSSLSYPLFTTSVNWTESASIAGDIMAQVRIRNIWFEQKSPTYRKYKTCYEVLEDLMTGFMLRLYYDRGLYHFEQISYMDNPTPTIYRYEIAVDDALVAGSTPTKAQINYTTNANIFARKGTVIKKRLAPLKAIELEQSKQFFNYMNGMAISTPGNVGPHNFGPIISTGNKIVAQWNGEIFLPTGWTSAAYSSTIKVEHILRFKVNVGSYYLVADQPIYDGGVTMSPNGQYHVSSGGTIPTFNWNEESSSTITMIWTRTFYSTSEADFNNQASAWRQAIRNSDIVWESNEIQEDGDMIFTFVDFTTKRNDVTIGGFPAGAMQLRKTSRIIIATGFNDLYEQPKGIKRWEIGDVNNTEIYPLSMSYYDSPERSTFAQLFITVSGVDYPTIGEWTDPDSELTLPIEDLVMKTALSLRKLPGRMYQLSVFFKNNGTLKFGDQFVINDAVHIILNYEMKGNVSGYTHYDILVWEVVKDYIGINIVDTGTPEIGDQQYPIPDGGLDTMRSNNNNQVGFEYFEMFTNVTNNYIDCGYNLTALVNLLNEFDIHTKWRFIVSGQENMYKPSGTLTPGEWRFDIDNNRFLFGKGSGPVRWVKIMKMY